MMFLLHTPFADVFVTASALRAYNFTGSSCTWGFGYGIAMGVTTEPSRLAGPIQD
jgi:hypothetical protein